MNNNDEVQVDRGAEGKEEARVDELSREGDVKVEPHYFSPLELIMSRQEEIWTWDIVYWVECNGEKEGIKKPTDYEFVQYALTTKGNTEEAIQRIRGMQLFRETYNVQDTIEEGIAAIRDFIRLHPGLLLHVDAFCDNGALGPEGGGLAAYDWSKFNPALARENLRNCMLFIYYFHHLFCPNFDAIRGGTRHLWEAGSGFKRETIDLNLEERVYEELVQHYPMDYREIRIYNSNFFFNWLIMMTKPFMSSSMRDCLRYGCQIEAAVDDERPLGFIFASVPRLTLPDLYLRPNYDVSMRNLLTRAEILLEEYYNNLRTFEF